MQGETLTLAHEVFDSLGGAPFVYTEDIPYAEDKTKTSIYDALERFHVVVVTGGGVPVHLRLLEGGYVMVDAFYGVCLRVQDNHMAQYEALLEALAY